MRMSDLHARASSSQVERRQELGSLFQASPLPIDDLLVNLPLYMRSSTVAKLLWIDELYRLIIDTPGTIVEFGTWWGANLALFESLRAVYEPYNYTRRVIGFDTFEGYTEPVDQDGNTALVSKGRFAVGKSYFHHLKAVLDYHEAENPMDHISKYELVVGDVSTTVPQFLERRPETIIALAYFDLQLYEPTKSCLTSIRPFLVPGSVIAMDELNAAEYPGETVAFREALQGEAYILRRSRYLPDRSYAIVR
jgi:Macrocin-O-methyltransferase (TylF)